MLHLSYLPHHLRFFSWGDNFECRLPITTDSLRYYYGENEKNGYDMTSGFFIPALKGYAGKAPIYKEKARTGEGFIMLDDSFLKNEELIYEYTKHIVYQIMHSNGRKWMWKFCVETDLKCVIIYLCAEVKAAY